MAQARVKEPKLFLGLNGNERPIRSPPRKYSPEERSFIDAETKHLLQQGIVRPSGSPWCSQVVVAKGGSKWRLCIDYSKTINKSTVEDAYPFPLISEIVNKLAQYRKFSKFDLQAAYNQVVLPEEDVPKTAFQANNKFFEFTRIPFGLKNAVSANYG